MLALRLLQTALLFADITAVMSEPALSANQGMRRQQRPPELQPNHPQIATALSNGLSQLLRDPVGSR